MLTCMHASRITCANVGWKADMKPATTYVIPFVVHLLVGKRMSFLCASVSFTPA